MGNASIRIRGARTHNLQDLDLDLPRQAWTVVCGVSGSGKSSLVLDTLGAESRRRFLGTLERAGREATVERPDVDAIEGLPPAVAAGFLARSPGMRQTLGTIAEVTHALRALFARAATPCCPTCGDALWVRSREAVAGELLARESGTRVVLLAPRGLGPDALEETIRDGFVRVRIGGGPIQRIEDVPPPSASQFVEAVVDRLVVKEGAGDRFRASVDQAFGIGGGVLCALVDPGGEASERAITFADRPFCGRGHGTWPRLSPATFSFDSPAGACPACEGRGVVGVLDPERVLPRRLALRRLPDHLGRYLDPTSRRALARALEATLQEEGLEERARVADMSPGARQRLLEGRGRTRGVLARLARLDPVPERLAGRQACEACEGTRLAPFARAARLGDHTLPELEALPVDRLRVWLQGLDLSGPEGALAAPARADALARVGFLEEVGLGYLAPARGAPTLSGGELRRARLAATCAARMSGLLYLLDEPTIGLHPAERPALRQRLRALVDEGNTVISVEHDAAALSGADHAVELGPGAGAEGGCILAEGAACALIDQGVAPIVRAFRKPLAELQAGRRRRAPALRIQAARMHNLRDVSCDVPLGAFTAITGPSGAGKSTLLLEVLAPALQAALERAPFPADRLDALDGVESIARLAVARGAPPRHPRATPGSVLGVLRGIQRLFAATLESRTRGWPPARFSRHVKGGRCSDCKGLGERRVLLRELGPTRLPCDACEGTGFARDTLQVRVKGLSIADVQALPLAEAGQVFRDLPAVARPLQAASDVGLGYLPLGEPTSRLSGGEALRLRLAAALGRGGEGHTAYLLDEPSAGLHPHDVEHLTQVLLRLAEAGHAVVAVEHHPTLVCAADHVIELGPGPGAAGGRLLYEGPPAGLLGVKGSPTGIWLREQRARGST